MAVVVAGGTRGIGLAIAQALAGAGDHAVLGYRGDHEQAARAVALLRDGGVDAEAVGVDVGTPEGCGALIAPVARRGGRITQLVHSAVQVLSGATLEQDPVDAAHAVAVNGISLLWLVQAALPLLDRGSTVFYLSSRGAGRVVPNYGVVGVGKAAGEALVRYLAVDLALAGVRVNAIAPGTQDTAALRQAFGEATDAIMDSALRRNPSGRLVRAGDYTGLIRFLASSEAEMITGQVLFVHGGADLLA